MTHVDLYAPARQAAETNHARGRPRASEHSLIALQRQAGNRAVSAMLALQRYKETVDVSGMGSGSGKSQITFGPLYCITDAKPGPLFGGFTDFAGSRIKAVILPEGTTGGTLQMHLFESTRINNVLFDDSQWGSWDGIVPFSVAGDAVTFGSPIIDSDVGGNGATMSVTMGSGATAGGGYATFNLMVAAAGSVSAGGGAGVGPISASAPIATSSTFAGGASKSFTMNLRTTPPKPVPGPDVDFKVGRATLADGQEGEISKWFRSLPDGVKDEIRNGKRSLTISGYASTTSRRRSNRTLSEQRAQVVLRILRGFAGSSASINVFYFGEDASTTPDEKEDPQWRRATIVVQVPSAASPGTPDPVK